MKKAKFVFLVRHAVITAIGNHQILSEDGMNQVVKISRAARARMLSLKTSKIRVFSSKDQSALLTGLMVATSLGVGVTQVEGLSLSAGPEELMNSKEVLAHVSGLAEDVDIVVIVGHHDQVAEMPDVFAKVHLGWDSAGVRFEKKHVPQGAYFEFNIEAGKCFLIQPPTPVP